MSKVSAGPAPSIDDLLGPAGLRFFGDGYRRTRPRLRTLRTDHDGTTSTLSGFGGISVPDAWSVKDGRSQRPHLATTDALALTAQSVGALLASRFDPATAAGSLVTDVRVQATNEPLEKDLDRFPITAELRVGEDKSTVAAFTARVGSLSTTGALIRPLAVASLAGLAVCAGDAAAFSGGPYGTAMLARSQRLDSVRVDQDGARAQSSLVCAAQGSAAPGLEAALQPAYTLVDVFVATLQLGQVLLYDLDSVDRGSSSTLWMRHTRVRTTRALPVTAEPVAVRVHLDRTRLTTKDDATWRLADVVGEVGPYTARAAVAHRLPAPEPVAAVPHTVDSSGRRATQRKDLT